MTDSQLYAEWVKSPADQNAWDEGCRPDPARAERVRAFFAHFLRHSKGEWAGQPFELLDWQWEQIVKPLFAWVRPDGTRRFRRAYIEVPKKNGKSTLGAGLALYLMLADRESGAEVYSAAADRRQATIVYNEVLSMIRRSPGLSRRLHCLPSVKRVTDERTLSLYEALSADAPTKEGLNIHGLIFDELHAQRTRTLWDTLTYGGAARRQPLLIAITTAGVYDPTSICWEQHQYAERILQGVAFDSSYFTFIAAAGKDDDWKSEATWRKANPSYGVTIKEDQFFEDFRRAEQSPLAENSFKRYRLNIWTEQAVRWISMDRWAACGAEPVDVAALAGASCFGGLDLASRSDLAAFSLVFPHDGGVYKVLPFFWVPAEACRQRERENRDRLDTWVAEGFITATPGNVIDYDRIRADINTLGKQFAIRGIAIDRWNACQISTQLQGDGFEIAEFGQGYHSMSAPSKEFEALVLAGRLHHGNNPVLRWNTSNVAADQDAAGNVKPAKDKSAEKIDGVVATIMALGLAIMQPVKKESVYKTRGFHVL